MKKILVVDDSATVRQQVTLALTQAGFQVEQAVDGDAGAQCIETQKDISMVICDINMPKLSGLEMLERVRPMTSQSNLPIVMLTTEGHPEMIQKAKALGAKGWMVKPFKANLLVQTAKKLTGAA